MPNSFNKGEWSEFYTFVKILADRKIYAADEDLERIEDIFYPILKVLRKENGINKIYDLSEDDIIQISLQGAAKTIRIPSSLIKSSVRTLFEQINNATGASFQVASSETLMPLLKCDKVKSDSSNKEDIKLIIHDSITLRDSEVGFSIKSNIGNSPTLLNASQATNFCYRVENFSGDAAAINAISTKSKIRDRLHVIDENSTSVNFSHLPHNVFRKNIRKSDSLMPLILSEYLLAFYRGHGSNIAELTGVVANSQVIRNLNLDFDYEDIKFKIKYLLLNIALGMVPSKLWDGFLKADGGYIVVKEDGDILCYHIYNIAQFSEYLFHHTRFETPSSSRHGFGEIYEDQTQNFINLNLQIRFI